MILPPYSLRLARQVVQIWQVTNEEHQELGGGSAGTANSSALLGLLTALGGKYTTDQANDKGLQQLQNVRNMGSFGSLPTGGSSIKFGVPKTFNNQVAPAQNGVFQLGLRRGM